MMLHQEYITAIENRLNWIKWLERQGAQSYWDRNFHGAPFPAYESALRHGSLFVMAPKFCELVEKARRSIPDDITFELPWVLAPAGWIWFATPFTLPLLEQQRTCFAALSPIEQMAEITVAEMEERKSRSVSFTGKSPESKEIQGYVQEWGREIEDLNGGHERMQQLYDAHSRLELGLDPEELKTFSRAVVAAQRGVRIARRLRVKAMGWYTTESAGPAVVSAGLGNVLPDLSVLFFGDDSADQGFIPISHFGLLAGNELGRRVEAFESWAAKAHSLNPTAVDAPYGDPRGMWRHEIRLAYTIFYLISQKLTITPRVNTDRPTRRRAEREKQVAPEYIQVITLRRLEEDRKRDPQGHEVDWAWHWSVTGHWRWQFYPSTEEHKRIWIHQFIKGDTSKPFKSPGIKMFIAKR
jgi:hypothetical protein